MQALLDDIKLLNVNQLRAAMQLLSLLVDLHILDARSHTKLIVSLHYKTELGRLTPYDPT